MDRKYLVFDIETAKVLPDGEQDIKAHRPLGIACAAKPHSRFAPARGKEPDRHLQRPWRY